MPDTIKYPVPVSSCAGSALRPVRLAAAGVSKERQPIQPHTAHDARRRQCFELCGLVFIDVGTLSTVSIVCKINLVFVSNILSFLAIPVRNFHDWRFWSA